MWLVAWMGEGIVFHDRLDRFVHLGLMGTVTVVR